jgi:hypothetical protein
VDALVAELEKLDECEWDRAPLTDPVTGQKYGNQHGRGHKTNDEAMRHETRAAAIRYFIKTGKVPHDFYEINNVMGTEFPGFARSIHDQDNLPQSIYAARDAGLNFAGASA